MRKICKQHPPQDLEHFIKLEKPTSWTDLHTSKRFANLYDICKSQLISEQLGLSGYTEKPLLTDVHIDHFRKRSMFNSTDFVFGWNNLIADEHSGAYGADHKDGTVKKEDYLLLISPVADDPNHFFTYQLNGNIIARRELDAHERDRANATIEIFCLNHQALRLKRERAIQMVREYKQGGLTNSEIRACMKDYGFVSVVDFALQ